MNLHPNYTKRQLIQLIKRNNAILYLKLKLRTERTHKHTGTGRESKTNKHIFKVLIITSQIEIRSRRKRRSQTLLASLEDPDTYGIFGK